MRAEEIKEPAHQIAFDSYGDCCAQAVCSCGWKGTSFTRDSRWDQAKASAYDHLFPETKAGEPQIPSGNDKQKTEATLVVDGGDQIVFGKYHIDVPGQYFKDGMPYRIEFGGIFSPGIRVIPLKEARSAAKEPTAHD